MNPLKNNNFTIIKVLPSLLTITSLLLGIFAINMAIENNIFMAIYFILIASIFDLLDGRLARLFNVTSDFGGELDSLSDFTTFGVAPAFIMYYGMVYDTYPLGWISICLFIVAALLRLARFNVSSKNTNNYSNYFIGIPVPAGALLLFLPFYLSFGFNIIISPNIVSIYAIIIALLMVSTIPTISTKKMIIKKTFLPIFISLLTLFILLLIYYTWYVLFVSSVLYLITLPITFILNLLSKQNLLKNN